jgi:hypothetical protein
MAKKKIRQTADFSSTRKTVIALHAKYRRISGKEGTKGGS